jgi:heme/copper-type cytochrome/quinol oxidase subunit 3
VSTAEAAQHHGALDPAESPITPESWGKLGMWTFLAADAMTFGGLLAAYGALRAGDPTWPVPSHILGIWLTAGMTFLLICSSVSMVESLAAIRGGDQQKLRTYLVLTILGGLTFICLQSYEWTKLILHEGQSITRNNFGATFFILTGFHGCHVFGGIVYLSAVLGRAVRGTSAAIVVGAVTVIATLTALYVTSIAMSAIVGVISAVVVAGIVYATALGLAAPTGAYSAHESNEVEIVGLYWHFVDLIWILVFTFIYLV